MLNEKLTIIVPQSRWAPNNSSRNFLKFVREQLNKSNSLKMLTRKAVSCTQSDLLHAPEYVCFNTLRYMLGQKLWSTISSRALFCSSENNETPSLIRWEFLRGSNIVGILVKSWLTQNDCTHLGKNCFCHSLLLKRYLAVEKKDFHRSTVACW